MSNHGLIRLIKFVSRFTAHLCNAIFFSTTFSTPCRRFTNLLKFWSLDLNKAKVKIPKCNHVCKTVQLLQLWDLPPELVLYGGWDGIWQGVAAKIKALFSCRCKIFEMKLTFEVLNRLITKLITELVCKLRDEYNEPN